MRKETLYTMPRPVSVRHAPMSMIDRGAQFAPFAALVGYGDVIAETARLTDEEIDLDENVLAELNRKLRILADHPGQEARFLYFEPDRRKTGGSYEWKAGTIKKIDLHRRMVVFTDGQELTIESIRGIEGVEEHGEGTDYPQQPENLGGAD